MELANRRFARSLCIAIGLLFVGALIADASYRVYQSNQWAMATIEPYNHTDVGVGDFFIDGTWGGISDPHSGGGSSLCCVMIPRRWHTGFQVTVKWQNDGSDQWLTQRVTIPRYGKTAQLQVHFMKNDVVKVVVFDLWPNQPSHPLYEELYGNTP